MSKQALNRPGFSKPIFNEAVIHNGTVYCSGKLGLSAETGELVSESVGEQTTMAIKLLEEVLHVSGSDLTKLLKCNIYITDMAYFDEMNKAYIAAIPEPRPARLCVEVSNLGRGAKVEIDCIAAL